MFRICGMTELLLKSNNSIFSTNFEMIFWYLQKTKPCYSLLIKLQAFITFVHLLKLTAYIGKKEVTKKRKHIFTKPQHVFNLPATPQCQQTFFVKCINLPRVHHPQLFLRWLLLLILPAFTILHRHPTTLTGRDAHCPG